MKSEDLVEQEYDYASKAANVDVDEELKSLIEKSRTLATVVAILQKRKDPTNYNALLRGRVFKEYDRTIYIEPNFNVEVEHDPLDTESVASILTKEERANKTLIVAYEMEGNDDCIPLRGYALDAYKLHQGYIDVSVFDIDAKATYVVPEQVYNHADFDSVVRNKVASNLRYDYDKYKDFKK